MKRLAFYSNAVITLCYEETLRRCSRNWSHTTFNINTWRVLLQYSSIDLAELLLATTDKCLAMSREQCTSTRKAEEWEEYPALQNKN